ncbi:MAG: M12 family metallo-peptidase [Planctomycetota bacterium]
MEQSKLAALLVAGWLTCVWPAAATADVCVVANRTNQPVTLRVFAPGEPPQDVRLASGEVRPLLGDGGVSVAFGTPAGVKSYQLQPNTAAFLGLAADGTAGLRRIGLGGTAETLAGRPLPGPSPGLTPKAGPAEITVKLLVDEDEPHRREVWEARLRSRVATASDVLSRHGALPLRVVGVGRWRSDDAQNDFAQSLREFESEADPGAARLAIGFTSQYAAPTGRTHLGGTRGPLRRHVLIREWPGVSSERERLELLVHELGHFFGATHSPEPDSVMRPVLADRRARRRDFAVRFDPVNTLIMAMVCEEVRRRGVGSFRQLTPGARQRLGQVYGVMGAALPDDPSSKRFAQLVRTGAPRTRVAPTNNQPTRRVLAAVVESATGLASLPEATRPAGDALTERYVRAAAAAAVRLPADQRPKALLQGLGIAMDDTATLRSLPQTERMARSVEPEKARRQRLAVLGAPTAAGRRDLAKHFFVSALLTATTDAGTADRLGVAKEGLDSSGGTGFSFADIAANRAGIRFAELVLSGRLRCEQIAQDFRLSLYMPAVEGLPEGLAAAELVDRFGGPGDERFDAQLAEVDRRIDSLPPYAVINFAP